MALYSPINTAMFLEVVSATQHNSMLKQCRKRSGTKTRVLGPLPNKSNINTPKAPCSIPSYLEHKTVGQAGHTNSLYKECCVTSTR